METVKKKLKLAIADLYTKKFFRNYDHLDLTGVDQDFVKQVFQIFINELFTLPFSELGKKRLTKSISSKFEALSQSVCGKDFTRFVEMKRLARGESRVYQIKKSTVKELKIELLKELESASKIENALSSEDISELFAYVAENLIFQKRVAETGSIPTFHDPALEEQIVDFWNEYYGVRFEELTHQDFDFTHINESISIALNKSHKDLLESPNLFVEYHMEPSIITIKSINGVSLLDPIVVGNFDPRKKKNYSLEKNG